MKKLSLILAAAATLFFSCDNFDEDEYLTRVGGDTEESAPITKTQNEQTVLLEDYTGWMCVNCPTATVLLKDLIETYGEKLVPMAVHAGSFAVPNANNDNLDLRTEYGTEWNSLFGLSSYPVGVLNRVNYGSTRGVQKDNWQSTIDNLLATTAHTMNINLGAKVSDGKVIVSAKIDVLENIDYATYVTVVITEDGITGKQYNNNSACGSVPVIDGYEFNHVLRTNGIIDNSLASSLTAGQSVEKNFAINIHQDWVTDNCHAVVFVTNASTGEVLQSNEIDL